jgi:hypothetical protein
MHCAWIVPAASPPFAEGTFEPNRSAKSARVDPRRDATSRVVDAGGYPMTAVGFHAGAATAESGEEEDAEGE